MIVSRSNHFDCFPATPWAHYVNASTTFIEGVWLDSSGNGRSTESVIGNGPVQQNNTLIFNSTDGLVFPSGSIPAQFTIAVVARFTNTTSAPNAIFSSAETTNWFLGWAGGLEDQVEFGIQKTPAQTNQPNFQFRKFAASNSPSEIAVISNGVEIGNAAGGVGGLTLVINKPSYGSDCEVQEVMIYDGLIFESDLVTIDTNLGKCIA